MIYNQGNINKHTFKVLQKKWDSRRFYELYLLTYYL